VVLVLVESPFAGDVERNLRYLRAAMRDCLLRGEAPFASHALYTQEGVLDDDKPTERQLGIDAGLLWGAKAEKTVVYADFGISRGMEYGIENAERAGRRVEYRRLPGWDLPASVEPGQRWRWESAHKLFPREFTVVEETIEDGQKAWNVDFGFQTGVFYDSRFRNGQMTFIGRVCGRPPLTPGFAPCTRPAHADGPCAHPEA
jgi:hypothetical protein